MDLTQLLLLIAVTLIAIQLVIAARRRQAPSGWTVIAIVALAGSILLLADGVR